MRNPVIIRLLYAVVGVLIVAASKYFDLGDACTLAGATLVGISIRGEMLPFVAAAERKKAARKVAEALEP